PGIVRVFCRMAAGALSGLRSVRPAFNLIIVLAETAGSNGLKTPVALPLTGATALCGLVARRRRNAPPPGKPLCDKTVANR
ncbi:hypothetical protein, partial [Klebsiella michiganensis]|uniref:hypothetical protein n=1 Tax=Klebsiella michiganensis TaxID=1134687 RepID=UPI001954AFFE